MRDPNYNPFKCTKRQKNVPCPPNLNHYQCDKPSIRRGTFWVLGVIGGIGVILV